MVNQEQDVVLCVYAVLSVHLGEKGETLGSFRNAIWFVMTKTIEAIKTRQKVTTSKKIVGVGRIKGWLYYSTMTASRA